MKTLLIRFALWILKKCGHTMPEPKVSFIGYPQEVAPYIGKAKELCQQQAEQYPDRSGEAKRHAVYARLIKEFPQAPHRDLSWAIDWVLR